MRLPWSFKMAIALVSLLLGMPAVSQNAQKSYDWDALDFNPKPLPDDVVLPMPCGGAMVFRKVFVSVGEPMQDYPVTLGSVDQEWGFLEGTHQTYIAGSFSPSAKDPGRYYLIGKYEVSALQYAALMDKTCPKPQAKLRIPKTSLSWFDAVEFGDRYTRWLLAQSPKSLPREDGVAGFLRLPTEVEWSFAARGGMKVTPSEFQARVFPMEGPMSQYVWYAGPQSSNGTIRPIGLLSPNPLGLHDVLGNADEMMFESFQMRAHGRSHGQSGGFVVRGGNYLTPQQDIRTSWRVEQPYYRDGQRNAIPTSGFRLVVVAPAITSAQRMDQLEKQWVELGSAMSNQTAQPQPDASDKLDKLATAAETETMRQELAEVRDQLRAANQLQREQSERAIRSSLQLGGFLCAQINQLARDIDRRKEFLGLSCRPDQPRSSAETCGSIESAVSQSEASLKTLLGLYSDTIVELGSIYSVQALQQQASQTEQALKSRSGVNLAPFVRTYAQSLQRYVEDRRVQGPQWLEQCRIVVQ